MSQCVHRVENGLAPVYCTNEESVGGYCVNHRMENPNEATRCLMQIPPGEPGNEAGTTTLRCKGPRVYGQPPYCAAHQPA